MRALFKSIYPRFSSFNEALLSIIYNRACCPVFPLIHCYISPRFAANLVGRKSGLRVHCRRSRFGLLSHFFYLSQGIRLKVGARNLNYGPEKVWVLVEHAEKTGSSLIITEFQRIPFNSLLKAQRSALWAFGPGSSVQYLATGLRFQANGTRKSEFYISLLD